MTDAVTSAPPNATGAAFADATVLQLHPEPRGPVPADGLYLRHRLHERRVDGRPFIYTNFVISLDGRVAVRERDDGALRIPDAIRNDRDWRLYQELSAQSDGIVVSAGHARTMLRDPQALPFPFDVAAADCDLKRWRRDNGLDEAPALLIASASLDLPAEKLRARFAGDLFVRTGEAAAGGAARRVEAAGIPVVRAGQGPHVEGAALAAALADLGMDHVYSVAGAGIMRELVGARVLDRLYLTQVHRFVGGRSFDSLLETEMLDRARDLRLATHYLDDGLDGDVMQTFSAFDLS